MKNMYFSILLLSSFLIVTMGITLFCYSVKKDEKLRDYELSRRLLAIAYLFLGGFGLLELLVTSERVGYIHPLAITITLSMGFIQSLLFAFSLTTLVNCHFLSLKRFLPYFLLNGVLILSLIIGVNTFSFPIFIKLAYWCGGCYYLLLVCYTFLFEKEYRGYKKRRDEYFAEYGSVKHFQWVQSSFYMSLVIGVLVCFSFLLPENVYPVYISLYTVFYIYFAIKYINYPSVFPQLLPVLEAEVIVPVGLNDKTSIEAKLYLWIERKGFITHGLTLDILAQELQTNRTYLSAYINQNTGCNFRKWISELRIEESKKIIRSNPDMPIEEIANRVGIPDRSSFYRQFVNLTGKSPSLYRKNDLFMG